MPVGPVPPPSFADYQTHAADVVRAAHRASDPAAALRSAWLVPPGPASILAVGKAAVPMARAAANQLGASLQGGLCLAPADQVGPVAPGVEVLPCDHPYPSAANVAAARRVMDWVRSRKPPERLIVLLSGGGSAYLTLPAPGLTLEAIAGVTRSLQRAGAGIRALNTVRKHCEQLKGGRLGALVAVPASVFVLSDVLGDPLDTIASGPFVPDPTTFADAIGVLRGLGLEADHPDIMAHLRAGERGEHAETPKPGAGVLPDLPHRVIANNRTAVEAVVRRVSAMGFHIGGVEHGVEGDAAEIGARMIERARELHGQGVVPGAWIIGGEWTVRAGASTGVGGPSQELALAAAIRGKDMPPTVLVAYSTDGRDGPTMAAGAVVHSGTDAGLRRVGVDPAAALAAHDSHTCLGRLPEDGPHGHLIRVAPTGTNVNHVVVVLTYPAGS